MRTTPDLNCAGRLSAFHIRGADAWTDMIPTGIIGSPPHTWGSVLDAMESNPHYGSYPHALCRLTRRRGRWPSPTINLTCAGQTKVNT